MSMKGTKPGNRSQGTKNRQRYRLEQPVAGEVLGPATAEPSTAVKESTVKRKTKKRV